MGHFEGAEENIRDEKDLRMKQIQDEKKKAETKAYGYAQARQESLGRALDQLQFLAYLASRSDIPQDHPMGVACLDAVFATIRQLLLPADGETPWRVYGE